MAVDLSIIDILSRREIEARIVVPTIKAFMKELGNEKELQIAERSYQGVSTGKWRLS